MLERFQGKDGRAALLNALRSQLWLTEIQTCRQVASAAPCGILLHRLFAQESGVRSVLILAGTFVRVGEHEVSTCGRAARGEIACGPFKGRSAKVDGRRCRVAQRQGEIHTIATYHPSFGAGWESSWPAGWSSWNPVCFKMLLFDASGDTKNQGQGELPANSVKAWSRAAAARARCSERSFSHAKSAVTLSRSAESMRFTSASCGPPLPRRPNTM